MMEEIALHVMDLIENSISSGAARITVALERYDGRLTIEVRDDGAGMDARTLTRAVDPFFTTKRGKRVGLGLALFRQAAEETGGSFRLESRPGAGSSVVAEFDTRHPDMKPVGDVAGTLSLLEAYHPEIEFVYKETTRGNR